MQINVTLDSLKRKIVVINKLNGALSYFCALSTMACCDCPICYLGGSKFDVNKCARDRVKGKPVCVEKLKKFLVEKAELKIKQAKNHRLTWFKRWGHEL